VRAPELWHEEAVREAWASGDPDWILTAVFAMKEIGGFENEILESLRSPDPEIHYQAVVAAGARELDAAWQHVFALAEDPSTEKDLRIAAIEAIGSIRPEEARGPLLELSHANDEDIAAAAEEALSFLGEPDDEEEDEDDEELF
jgi:HEAT repeat protein